MPDVDEDALERDAGVAIDLRDDPVEPQDGALADRAVRGVDPDVGPIELLVDVVRTLGQLGDDDAGGQGTGDRGGRGAGEPGTAPSLARRRRRPRSTGSRSRVDPGAQAAATTRHRRRAHQREDFTSRQHATDQAIVVVGIEGGQEGPGGLGVGSTVVVGRGHRAAPSLIGCPIVRRVPETGLRASQAGRSRSGVGPAASTAARARAAGTAWTTRIRRLTVAAPYRPATMTQAEEEDLDLEPDRVARPAGPTRGRQRGSRCRAPGWPRAVPTDRRRPGPCRTTASRAASATGTSRGPRCRRGSRPRRRTRRSRRAAMRCLLFVDVDAAEAARWRRRPGRSPRQPTRDRDPAAARARPGDWCPPEEPS